MVDGDVNMNVSPVMGEKGHKYAFVSFDVDGKFAEGKIPDCKVFTNKGFTEEEVEGLETYLKDNLDDLKKISANVNVMRAFMK